MTNEEIDQSVYNTAIKGGFTPISAKFVVAQARLESGHYASDIFKNNNNSFGMKYIEQPLATKGSLAPYKERSGSCKANGVCSNSDYYAKYSTVEDSIKDVIERNYNKTMNGVTPAQLKNSKTPEEYAALLKKRGYYGATESLYASTIKSILNRVKVLEIYNDVKNVYKNNSKGINYGLIAISLIGITYYAYYLYKKGIIKI
jgi:flagellum-specific peptidoglycan hydrolase FlgJ